MTDNEFSKKKLIFGSRAYLAGVDLTLSGNVNDYDPGSAAFDAASWKIDGGASDRTITGIRARPDAPVASAQSVVIQQTPERPSQDGRLLYVINAGDTNALILAHASTSSQASN